MLQMPEAVRLLTVLVSVAALIVRSQRLQGLKNLCPEL